MVVGAEGLLPLAHLPELVQGRPEKVLDVLPEGRLALGHGQVGDAALGRSRFLAAARGEVCVFPEAVAEAPDGREIRFCFPVEAEEEMALFISGSLFFLGLLGCKVKILV